MCSVFQNQLPVTGAPVTGQRSSQIKEHYTSYVHAKTVQNWKFWIVSFNFNQRYKFLILIHLQFSIIMESLLDSYCSTVATTNYEEMYKTLLRWLDQSCCLITLRRGEDKHESFHFKPQSISIQRCTQLAALHQHFDQHSHESRITYRGNYAGCEQ